MTSPPAAPVPTDRPAVRPIGEHELDAYYRVDAAAFGVRHDTAQVEAKRTIVEPGRLLMASVDGLDVGVAGSFAFDLTLPGGAAVPVCGVSDVGVLPTHRRRGVLRALLSRLLDDASDRGEVAAVLTASQATIYGRFGFGVASRRRSATVPAARSAFRPEAPVADGRVRVVEREAAVDLLADVHARSARNGSLSRSAAWWAIVLGEVELFLGGHPDHRVLVHEDDRGLLDAYALYRIEERWTDTGPAHRLHVREVVGATTAAELSVWRTLLDHDLVDRVHAALPVDHVLGDVLEDPRALVTEGERDVLWCRPLDVAALLSARTYATDGALVLGVADGFRPDRAGAYRLEVSTGCGGCERADGWAVDLELDVADLGACSLGGSSFRRLVRAGRVREVGAGAAARADAMFTSVPLPWTDTLF